MGRNLDWFIKKYGEEEGKIRYTIRSRSNAARINKDDADNVIRCLECGAIVSRIQHTHLKNKCSGNLKTIQEYKNKYPGADVIAPSLRKLGAITLENLVKKYGEEEGLKRWDEYRERQRYSNTLAAKQEKYGWSEEQFSEYNKSRAITLENLVKKYGEEEGLKRWDEYRERQRYTTSQEYFIETYGNDVGMQKFKGFCKGRVSCGGVSAPEIEMYSHIVKFCPNLTVVSQFVLPSGTFSGGFDVGVSEINALFEFYGDFWHMNPNQYQPDDVHPVKNKSAGEIWKFDSEKIKAANSDGFDVFVVWEHDWKNKRNIVLAEIEAWIALKLSGQKLNE